nr:PREDICTED: beta-hexosaminidase subunit beta-like [Bemisia tabaci]XP_018914553.1 PREDICTED: beta-hexosaminidase subunit beta-like [Bemisia tabaci]XP_018914554.1 PREDICTED: beta-hexosaminidase subunit beta-like [Bemisia tabaci]
MESTHSSCRILVGVSHQAAKFLLILLVFFTFLQGRSGFSGFGPEVKPTKGALWPRPSYERRFNFSFAIDPKDFEFQSVGQTCPILEKALDRYKLLIKNAVRYGKVDAAYNKDSPAEVDATKLPALRVDLRSPCEEIPSDNMDESYNLTVSHFSSALLFMNRISANSIWGILRGLESFSQVLVPDKTGRMLIMDGIFIEDEPRFKHRGLLLDTSRHFFSVPEILQVLDGMAYNKYNVFHWHIVDDQSFPYQSVVYPQLSLKGAYHPELAVYSLSDIENVIDFARDRGIRVIPEFDTPGHTLSWGASVKGLLAQCNTTGEYGPVDPSEPNNYVFLQRLLIEIASVFKDKYIHLGGDEVEIKCWEDNPKIASFMNKYNMSRNFTELETYYFTRLLNITNLLNLKPVVWQEVFDFGVDLDPKTIIHVWKSEPEAMKPIVSRGYEALFSSCWYLDHLSETWRSYYHCDILDFDATSEERTLVIGGEACMWGEWVDETNVSPRIWPRACAPAERLWSYGSRFPHPDTAARLEEHACRLKRRGIPTAPPNGPGYCPLL